MTSPEIPHETIELATIAWYEATPGVSWADAGIYERAAMLTRSKLILEAALPHLRVQETPRKAFDAGYNIVNQLADLWEVPVDVRQATNDRCWEFAAVLVASAAPHPRPVVDREALMVAMGQADGAHNTRSPEVRAYAYETLYGRFADAVLALVPTVAADSDLNEHLTGRTWPDLQHHLIHDHGLSAAFVSHKNGPWASIHEDAHNADDSAETDGREPL
jgi:hypothetical protein